MILLTAQMCLVHYNGVNGLVFFLFISRTPDSLHGRNAAHFRIGYSEIFSLLIAHSMAVCHLSCTVFKL